MSVLRSLLLYASTTTLVCGAICLHAAPRSHVSLDGPWKFRFGQDQIATSSAFNDGDWSTVTVPHSWPEEGAFLKDESFRTRATYRCTFVAQPGWRNKRVILQFDAASLAADVYLNGGHIGRHEGGFAAFNFDITDALLPGQTNTLAVQVTNEKLPDVSPLAGDFLIYGGLYRHVSLTLLDPVNITPLDHASSGVFVSTQRLDHDEAAIEVRTNLRNDSLTKQKVVVKTEVIDAYGKVVAHDTSVAQLADRTTTVHTTKLALARPHLWNGVADPYLYSVRISLRRKRRTVDSVTQSFGLRTIQFDAQRGLVLNGRPMQIRGVGLHQEGAAAGWAVSVQDELRDMQIIREMGADGIRLAHYQHSQSFLDLADKNGMLIWAELAQVDRVHASGAYRQNIRQQLIELIRQNYNHPSIFTWSLYNELNPPTKDAAIPLVKELNVLAHAEDPSRPTTGADDKDTLEQFHDMIESLDLVAFNTYPGWYFGTPADMGAEIDKWNVRYGSRGISVSEYGAGASTRQHADPPIQKTVQIRGTFHPEEWQTRVHEQTYPAIRQRPFVWGAFIWNMFDFGSYGRHEGDTPGVNDKGLVTRDRKTRKDAFYYYQANWSRKPMVHLAGCRFDKRPSGEVQIKAYSNESPISMQLNGVSMGSRTPDENHIAAWDHVALSPGTVTVQVQSPSGQSDHCTITVEASLPSDKGE